MKTKRIISVIFIVIVSVLSFALPAGASWYDDVSGGTYKTISGNPFVADTFYGVDALYSTDSKVYQCNELINRFYKQAYGMNIFAGGQYGILSYNDNYTFKKLSLTDTPKTGDIIYASSENKNGNGVHWALVKSYNNGVITMFEQNVIWQGKAGIDRKLKWPSDGKGYTVYTPVGKNGHSDPVLKKANITSDTTAATNYTYPKEVVESLNGKTTTTTTKPETSATTTTKPTTTKPATTEPATTKPTTTKKETTSAVSKTEKDTTKNSTSSTTGASKTTSKSTTAKPAATTKKVTTTKQKSTESTTVITTSEETTEFTAVLTTVSETRVYTEAETEETETIQANESESSTPRTVLICEVAAVACMTAGAAVVLIKKRKK